MTLGIYVYSRRQEEEEYAALQLVAVLFFFLRLLFYFIIYTFVRFVFMFSFIPFALYDEKYSPPTRYSHTTVSCSMFSKNDDIVTVGGFTPWLLSRESKVLDDPG